MSVVPWIQDLLNEKKMQFLATEHPNAYTAQQLAHNEHTSGHRVAKIVVVYTDTRPLMLVLPASRRVSMGTVREIAGAKEVHLAAEGDMRELFPDCEVGAEPPLPHGKPIPIWIDNSMLKNEDILFPGGTHRDTVRMRFQAWFDFVKPRTEDFSVEPGRLPPKPAHAF